MDNLTEVLDIVNRVRAEFGQAELSELPKGAPGCSVHCPLAQALYPNVIGVTTDALFARDADDAERIRRVVGTRATESLGYWCIELPRALELFSEDFDHDGERSALFDDEDEREHEMCSVVGVHG